MAALGKEVYLCSLSCLLVLKQLNMSEGGLRKRGLKPGATTTARYTNRDWYAALGNYDQMITEAERTGGNGTWEENADLSGQHPAKVP